jgi:hypothetical protein
MATLVNAFSYAVDRITPEMVEIYWEDLKNIPDTKFGIGKDDDHGVGWCRHHLKFFPSISEIGSACYNGNPNWYEVLVQRKRLAAQQKIKSLEPPISAEDRLENQKKIMAIASSLSKSLDAVPDVTQAEVNAERQYWGVK